MKSLLALLAGVFNALSYAPFNYWPLIFVSLALLFFLWLESNRKDACFYGFLYGISMFSVGISWIYISIHRFGGLPPFISVICIFFLVSFLSIYPALSGFFQALFIRWMQNSRLFFIMPSIWLLFEWMRGWLFTGLPWLTTGYAVLDTPLSDFVPIGGVYLLSFIVLVTTGLLIALIKKISIRNGFFGFIILIIWMGGWSLNERSWTHESGNPINVAIIQNNVSLIEKWDKNETDNIIQTYLEKSELHQDVDLIVWPESAVPNYLDNLSINFWTTIHRHPADFVFGVLYREKIHEKWKYYNAVAAVSDKMMMYRKQHLVPFGEYLPFPKIFNVLIRMMDMPRTNFSHWYQIQKPLIAAGNYFAVSICYEDAFPRYLQNQIIQSGVLINVSDDMWFGDSFAPHQRLQMARFRSRESERPMIRSSNNGFSSIINWKGELENCAPQFKQHIITGDIQPRSGSTPYVRFGDYPVLLLALGLFILALFFGHPKLNHNHVINE